MDRCRGPLGRTAAHRHPHTRAAEHPLTAATLADARQLGEYFLTHAQAAYDAIGADPAVHQARIILEWATQTSSASVGSRGRPRLPLSRRRQDVIVQMNLECGQKGVQISLHAPTMGALHRVRTRFGNFPSTI
ncbi:hypothetical protein [Actinomadura macrotermitis]|uniref:hypothetical protein n=1 Tax=Actinomadura macrotermitis TaxID=2585200 RepID=UPI001296B93C|nr:hypothetical protein [Actinomadura macrotermitis]